MAAQGDVFQPVDLLAEEQVVEIAVAIGIAAGQTEQHRVLCDRPRNRKLATIFAAGAATQADIAFEIIGRHLGVDDDRATGRVAAVKCALRPTQHFDAIEIEQRLVEAA